MKCLIRYLSLLLCVVSLFLVFSLNANAEYYDELPQYTLTTTHIGDGSLLSSFTVNPFDTDKQEDYNRLHLTSSSSKFSTTHVYEFSPMDTNILFVGGYQTTINVSGLRFFHSIDLNGGNYPSSVPDSITVVVDYLDGTVGYVNDVSINGTMPLSLSFEFKPTKQVTNLSIYVYDDFSVTSGSSFYYNYKSGEVDSVIPSFSVDIVTVAEQSLQEQKESKNLLTKIKDGISNLKDGITNVFNKLGDVVSAITQLPQKLWNLIQEGLKSLFVPDDDYLVSYKEEWDSLMRDRFGALYEVPNLVIDIAMGIDFDSLYYEPVIYFPEVTIPLPDNESFTFGGYDVWIIPEEFTWLSEYVRVITTCCCFFLFVGGLRKRYDNIVGG